MAVFSVVTRKKITDSKPVSVYIRITHNSKTDYIKTNYKANYKSVEGTNVTARNILNLLDDTLERYSTILGQIDTTSYTVTEIKDLLLKETADVSFSDYFNEFIGEMSKSGRDNQAVNYVNAFNSLKKFMFGVDDVKKLRHQKVLFSDLKVSLLNDWVYSLRDTSRAKNHYPTCIRAVFRAGLKKFNDYDVGMNKIKNNPFEAVKIPKADVPEKRSISTANIKKLFNAEPTTRREQLGQDMAKMIFYLAGINLADIYTLEVKNLDRWTLKYNRHKTKDVRDDKSYFEIKVPDEIKPLFEKYKGNDRLFVFSEQYSETDNFTKAVNVGLRALCEVIGIQAVTSYTLRHSWATIARNSVKASIEDVAFCLNHASAHRITEDYIQKDFSIVNKINSKVIKYINSNKSVS